MADLLPHIRVACALVEEGGKVLAAMRGPGMSMPGVWEFPGGKIAEGEAPEDAIRRELFEELSLRVRVICPLPLHSHRYPSFLITLHPFVCAIEQGTPTLSEHCEVRWLGGEEMRFLEWAEADLPVIGDYLGMRAGKG